MHVPVTAAIAIVDTDMTRDLELPKASAESVALVIFDGLENAHEDIFPDSMSHFHCGSVAHKRRQGSRAPVHRIRAAGATNLG